ERSGVSIPGAGASLIEIRIGDTAESAPRRTVALAVGVEAAVADGVAGGVLIDGGRRTVPPVASGGAGEIVRQFAVLGAVGFLRNAVTRQRIIHQVLVKRTEPVRDEIGGGGGDRAIAANLTFLALDID